MAGTPDPSNSIYDPSLMAMYQKYADDRTALQNSLMFNPNIIGPDGSTQTVSYGNAPDYGAYVRNNPDLYEDFQKNRYLHGAMSIEDYGRMHYEQYGKQEGRQLPSSSLNDQGYYQPTVTTKLSPQEQAIFDADQRIRTQKANTAEGLYSGVAGSVGTPFDLNKLGLVRPEDYVNINDQTQYTTAPTEGGLEQVRQALVARYQPQFDDRRSQTENDLLLRGFNPGTQGYEQRMEDIGRQENDFWLGAMEQAGAEQERLHSMQGRQRAQDFAEDEQLYGMSTDYRDRQIQEALLQRQQPLNELNSFMTGSMLPLPNMQPYQGTATNAPDWSGAAQESYNRNFIQDQQKQAKKDAFNQGLWDLAGTGVSAWAGRK